MTMRYGTTLLLSSVLFALPAFAQAAALSLDPVSGTYGPGDTFIETVRIDNGSDCINAANVVLTYPTQSLRAIDFSRGDSILTLWVDNPNLDTEHGTVSFSGGIPGGYCGRVPGDAGLSNVLGEVVFTVVNADAKEADIQFSPASRLYANDGQGSEIVPTVSGATITLSPTAQLKTNPWLALIGQDTTPPQPFVVDVESTSGVFGGKYYAVFSTTDKESGLDHFDIFEDDGWKAITSPYLLKNQSLLGLGDVKIRAVDKAGNIRMGTYVASSTPKRIYSTGDLLPIVLILLAFLVLGFWFRREHHPEAPAAS